MQRVSPRITTDSSSISRTSFMDVLGIEPGADFVKKLESTVDKCDVLLALIGKRWAGEDRAVMPHS